VSALRRVLAQAGLLMAGGLFLILAALLAALAAWLQLVALMGAVLASLIVAGGFLFLGLILVLLSQPRRRRRAEEAEREAALRDLFAEAGLRVPDRGERPPLIEAFLFGLTTALRLGRTGRR